METNVVKNSKIPAGIISGTEAFWFDDTKWVSHEGITKPFHQQPGAIQRMIANAFLADTKRRNYLRKIGIVKFSEAFETWFRCVIGGIDSISDFDQKGLHPDIYNNQCTEINCPHRGKLCGMESNLKSYQVATIKVVSEGATISEAAEKLFLSTSGMKTRWEKIKEQLGTKNVAETIARSVQLGVI